MIAALSIKIADVLLASQEDKSRAKVIAYGAECFLSTLISDLFLLGIGLVTGHLLELVIWTISYTLLRSNTGGAHANTHFWCIIIGTGIGASTIFLSPLFIGRELVVLFAMVFCGVMAVMLAPVRHKNKPLRRSVKTIKQTVILICIAELAMGAVLLHFAPLYGAYFALGMIMASVFALAGYFVNPR